MALQWDVTKVANYHENFPDEGSKDNPQWNSTTMTLVWLAIPCAWGWQITEDNYLEAFTRINMYEHLRGAMRSKTGKDGKAEEVFVTLAEVQKHIGMTVNVSLESPAKFHSKLAKMMREDSKRECMKQAEELSKVTV